MNAISRQTSLAFALAALAIQGYAADLFTVNVPVEFKSLHPDILTVEIICRLRGKDPVTSNLIYYAKKLPYAGAEGKTTLLKPINGDVPAQTVKFSFTSEDFEAQELKNLNLVTMADCNFGLRSKDGNTYSPAGANPAATTIAPKPGTPFNETATAKF